MSIRSSVPDSDAEENRTQSPKEDGKEALGRAPSPSLRLRRAPAGHRGPSSFWDAVAFARVSALDGINVAPSILAADFSRLGAQVRR